MLFMGMKALFYILLALAIGCAVYLTGYNVGIRQNRDNQDAAGYTVRHDTIRITDTVTAPYEVTRTRIRHDTIFTPKDTVFIPIERAQYVQRIENDSVKGEIRATVSGYDAHLDSLVYDIHVDRRTVFVTSRKKWGFCVGPAVGVGYAGRKIEPYIGFGITYGFNF